MSEPQITTFILNSGNVNPNNKNQMILNFPQKLQIFEGAQVALLNTFINYSWFNLTPAFNNQSVSYYWPPSQTTHLITFPTAFFLTSDINAYIQENMVANGDYLIDQNGANVYYMSLVTNYTIYGNSLILTPLPSSLPAGWTLPSNFEGTLSAGNAVVPQLQFNNTNFGALIGFAQNTNYPSVVAPPNSNLPTTLTIINSPLIPEITPVVGCFITTNLVNQPNYNQYGDVIYSFTPNVQFGSTIDIEPPQSIWFNATAGFYQSLVINFTDSLHNPLGINDTNMVVTLMLKYIQKNR